MVINFDLESRRVVGGKVFVLFFVLLIFGDIVIYVSIRLDVVFLIIVFFYWYLFFLCKWIWNLLVEVFLLDDDSVGYFGRVDDIVKDLVLNRDIVSEGVFFVDVGVVDGFW